MQLSMLFVLGLCWRWAGAQNTCMDALISFSHNATNEAALIRYLSRSYASCLEAVATQPSTIKVTSDSCSAVTAAMSSQHVSSSLMDQLLCYESDSNWLGIDVLDELHGNMSDAAAGWLLPPWFADQVAESQVLMPVGQVLSPAFDGGQVDLLDGLPTYFKRLATSGTGSAWFFPVDGSLQLLFYRTDVLASRNWSVPATWVELADMAEQLNGTDLNEDGQPDWGICMDGATDCSYSEVLGAIAAPMLQYNGTSQGTLFDPDNLNPLFNTTAFEQALELFTRLTRLSPPLQDSPSQFSLEMTSLQSSLQAIGSTSVTILLRRASLGTVLQQNCEAAGSGRFQAGRCAFTIGTGQIWKSAQAPISQASYLLQQQALNQTEDQWYAKGRIGVSMLPGSNTVLDRTTNQLMPCNATICPYGVGGKPEMQLIQAMNHTGDRASTGVHINRALYTPTCGTAAAVSSSADTASQQGVAALWYALIQPDVHNKLALSFAEPNILPMRDELLTVDALSQFTAAGFHPNDTLSYIQAATATLQHPNLVPSPAIDAKMPLVRTVMDYAAHQAVHGVPSSLLATQMQQYIVRHVLQYDSSDLSKLHIDIDDSGITGVPAMVLLARASNLSITDLRAIMRSSYREAIGYWGYDSNPFTTPALNSSSTHDSLPVVALVVPITSAVIVLLLAVLYEMRKHYKYRNLFGKVVAPGPSPETTLLVTDIESSTTLWELLPPHVMDLTLHHHHACIRHILLKHDGYESATEGDSFILAFHCPEDAVLFALECQVSLLECPWPAELLECEQCTPFYIVQMETNRSRLGGIGSLDEDMLLADRLQGSAGQLPEYTPLPNIPVIAEEEGQGQHDHTGHTGTGGQGGSLPHHSAGLNLPCPGSRCVVSESEPALVLGTAGMSTQGPTQRGALSLPGLPNPLHDASRHQLHRMHTGPSAHGAEKDEAGQVMPHLLSESVTLGHSSLVTSQGGSRAAEHTTISSVKATSATQGGTSTASSPMGERTFLSEVQLGWRAVSADTPNAVLLFRGLRVRMGMACAHPTEADVAYNKAAARTQYGGELLLLAKAVSDAAPGAAILMNDMAHAQLPMENLWDKALVMDIGEYVLNDTLPPQTLFRMVGRRVMGRIAYLTVSRVQATISRGVLAAPLGNVAVAHAQLVGAQQLLAWNEALAQEALDTFHEVAEKAMGSLAGGYMVQADAQQGQITAVFALASEALVWALTLQQALLDYDWPAELLEHELCEELTVNGAVVFRGPKCKAGVDSGNVVGEVSPQTGRCVYRGRPVTRSLRVMQLATSNQVLCTNHAWQAANMPSNVGLLACHHVTADRLGMFKLKGERLEKTELLQCRLGLEAMVNKRHGADDMLSEDDILGLHVFPEDIHMADAGQLLIGTGVQAVVRCDTEIQ